MNISSWLWLAAQLVIGGTYDKRKLALSCFRGERHILEVGCAVGNVSSAFLKFPDVEFVGVDIDAEAIDVARFIFRRHKRFNFVAGDVVSLLHQETRFDLILLAGVLHHVPDLVALQLIDTASKLLKPGGKLVISEPEPPRPQDSLLVKFYGRIERGKWMREQIDLINLTKSIPNLTIVESTEKFISPFIFGAPECVRFALIQLQTDS